MSMGYSLLLSLPIDMCGYCTNGAVHSDLAFCLQTPIYIGLICTLFMSIQDVSAIVNNLSLISQFLIMIYNLPAPGVKITKCQPIQGLIDCPDQRALQDKT